MSNFDTLNFKTLMCMGLATLPTLLVLNGLDNATNQAVAQAEIRMQGSAAPAQLPELASIAGQTVLVD